MEWSVYWIKQWAFVEFLEYAGRFSVVVAVVFYIAGRGDRAKAKHYEAWQVINAAAGRPGTGGRIDALQDLSHDGISLAGVDLSGGARLPHLHVPGADLNQAILFRAVMDSSDLRGCKLQGANLSLADLRWADLRDADLTGAVLDSANLYRARLHRAVLAAGTSLRGCTLAEADLSEVSWWGADLHDADLINANLAGAVQLSREQLLEAEDWRGARLPEYLKDLEVSSNTSPDEMKELKKKFSAAGRQMQ
jgi:hypothetical protein